MSDGVLDELDAQQGSTLKIIQLTAEAVDTLRSARKLNHELQKNCARSEPAWKVHQAIEDLIDKALSKLGE